MSKTATTRTSQSRGDAVAASRELVAEDLRDVEHRRVVDGEQKRWPGASGTVIAATSVATSKEIFPIFLDDVAILEAGDHARGIRVIDRSPVLLRRRGPGVHDELVVIVGCELALGQTLHGPVLLPIYGGSFGEGEVFVVEEHAAGVPLRSLFGRTSLPLDVALYVASEVLSVRPWIRFCGPDPIATQIGWDGAVWREVRVTGNGRDEVAFALLSPELARGDRTSEATWVHLAGVITHWLATGTHPIVSHLDNVYDVLQGVIDAPRTPIRTRLPDVPARVAEALDASIARDPKNRPSTWDEVVATCGSRDRPRARSRLARHLAELHPRQHAEDLAFWSKAASTDITTGPTRIFRSIAPAQDVDAALEAVNANESSRVD